LLYVIYSSVIFVCSCLFIFALYLSTWRIKRLINITEALRWTKQTFVLREASVNSSVSLKNGPNNFSIITANIRADLYNSLSTIKLCKSLRRSNLPAFHFAPSNPNILFWTYNSSVRWFFTATRNFLFKRFKQFFCENDLWIFLKM